MKVTPLDTPNHKSPSAPCTLCSSPGDRLSSLCKPQAALATLGLPGPALKDAGSPPCLSTGEAIPLRGLEGVPGLPGAPQAEGLLFLHGLESNPGSSLQTEEEAGLP